MSALERPLHVVRPSSARPTPAPTERSDVGLTVFLLLVAALPLASAVAGVGRWDAASLGLGALGVLLAGRELGSAVLARWRDGGGA
jgi:hypothetical protein